MKRALLIALALLMGAAGMAETGLPDPAQVIGGTELADLAEVIDGTATEVTAGRELSGYFGQTIATAAAQIGGLTFEAGEEYAESYADDALALRGNGGVVTFIDLKPDNTTDTLCGIRNGMYRNEAQALMEGVPQMWDYPEELAWLIRDNAEDELKDEILVVFFDEDGKVSGAWYRISGM